MAGTRRPSGRHHGAAPPLPAGRLAYLRRLGRHPRLAPAATAGTSAQAADNAARTLTAGAGQHVGTDDPGKLADGITSPTGAACRACPLAAQCTSAKEGRTITIGPHEARLAAARQAQACPAWQDDYKATRPKVERKIGHLMRRRHGGRLARVRGRLKVAADFALLAAAVNLARLGVLGLACDRGTWVVAS